MKIRIYITSLVMTFLAVQVFGQKIENDDMYFTSKDRALLKEQSQSSTAYASVNKTKKKIEREEEATENPTDSYSARNTNPEYSSRSNAETAQADNQDYFLNNYQYQTAANLNNWNNQFNNWYGNSWYRPNYWSPSIYSWNSPFYGNYYGSPWNDPYYRSTWSGSFSYHWGSTWNYGWDPYGMWDPYNSWAWNGWGSGWGLGFGSRWGNGFGWNNYYSGWNYPRVIVVNNNYGEGKSGIVYGKRPSRSSSMVSEQANTRTRTSSMISNNGSRGNSGGRTSASSTNQGDYYNRTWRYTTPSDGNSTGSYNSGSGSGYSNTNTRTRSSSYGSDSYNSGRSSSTYRSNDSYTPSRTSGSSYSGSSGSSSSGGGSNGRSRGGR